ncbi:MAG: thioredoxin domain-containing protein [Mycobacterium leprae]
MPETATPNRLAHEASPYLQQHAHNPVDWYPWGPEALAKAKAEEKPIFLSVGYSACHWCHVMAHESFEEPAIAAVMNEHFINIKVDREERPDLDQIYQSICQIVTRHGGWPLSVWLTPDQKPFYVGTYFPPAERYGRPGFRQVLESLARAYREERGEVDKVADNWTAALSAGETPAASPGAAAQALQQDLVVQGARALADHTDRRHGGFGGAPKFPNATALDVMLRAWKRTGDEPCRDLALLTLRKMGEGGVYDQLGGGFHRYSVDARWAVPHFEKMLYDNATLPPVYLSAWQAAGEPLYRQIAEETLQYVMREMTHPDGGFYSSTDADSEGDEGKYFVWDRAEVLAATGDELGDLLCRRYGVTAEGNFEQTGKTVLYRAVPTATLAEEQGVPESELLAKIRVGRQHLLAVREQRVPPGRDDKILTAWNGLMITAFARAGRILRETSYITAARRAAGFVLSHLTDGQGNLLRRYKEGDAAIGGYLEDYAYFAAALLDLYEATFNDEYLQAAIRYTRDALARFYDGQGSFYVTAAEAEPLIHRPKDDLDSSTPAGTGIMAATLLRLHPFTGDEAFREVAEAIFSAHWPQMERYPSATASLLQALDLYQSSPTEVTLIGETPEDWLAQLGWRYLPNLVLTRIAAPRDDAPIWAGKSLYKERPTIYVCRNFACSPPANDWAEAALHLE